MSGYIKVAFLPHWAATPQRLKSTKMLILLYVGDEGYYIYLRAKV